MEEIGKENVLPPFLVSYVRHVHEDNEQLDYYANMAASFCLPSLASDSDCAKLRSFITLWS